MPSKDIKYLNKDFDGFKADLVSFAKTYYPDEYKDFNETSTGMLLLENVAYVGDVLSFYLDKQFKETFITTASERKNIIDRAAELGYLVKGNSSSSATLTVYCEVDATDGNEGDKIPTEAQAPTIKRNSTLTADNGTVFRISEDVDFSIKTGRQQAVSERNKSGVATKFVLKKDVLCIAGDVVEEKFVIGALGTKTINDQVIVPEKGVHLELQIDDTDVMSVETVIDSSDNEYFEVPYLAQDTVYLTVPNTDSDSDIVPQNLKLKKVPRRFITRFTHDNKLKLVFGNGTENLSEEVLIANPGDVAIPLRGRKTFTASPINPENFTRTNTMGIMPVSTTLTVNYVKGGGSLSNVPSNSINSFSSLTLVFDSSVSTAKKGQIRASIAATNQLPAVGGANEETDEQIRDNAALFFSSQDRCVTQEDFIVRAMSMPKDFGQVFRANAIADKTNNGTVQLYVLSKNSDGSISVPSSKLKENLKQYLRNYRMLTEQIEILNGLLITIGVDFSIVAHPDYSKNLVLSNCLFALKNFFDVDNWQIGQSVIISDIYEELRKIDGVLSISDVRVINKTTASNTGGLSYSTQQFTVASNDAMGIITPPENAMLYVKYPTTDLRGSVL